MKKKLILLWAFIPFFGFSQVPWSLKECIDYAIQNNLAVQASLYNKKIQDYALKISKNQYLPSVSAQVNNILSLGQTQGFQGSIGRNDNFNNSANLSASILLYNGGRLGKEVEKSNYDLQAALYDLEAVKNNIAVQVLQQYFTVLLSKELLEINKSALENAQKHYQRAQITTEVGTTAKTVLVEAEAALARAKQNYKNAEIETKRNLFTLAQTMRVENYKDFDISKEFSYPLASLDQVYDLDTIAAQSLKQQPQIKASENRWKSAEVQTKVLQTALLPTVTASAGLGSFYFNSLVTNITGVDMVGNLIREKDFLQQYKDNFSQQLSVSVNIPIFNKGNTKLQIEQAKVNEEIAKNNLEQVEQQYLQTIQKILFDIETHKESLLAAIVAKDSAGMALEFATKSYTAGRTTIYDLNTAENNHVNALRTATQAEYNLIFNIKLLEFYIGRMVER